MHVQLEEMIIKLKKKKKKGEREIEMVSCITNISLNEMV